MKATTFRVDPKERVPSRLIRLMLAVGLLWAVLPLTSAAAAVGDIAINFNAAAPETYDHATGGGAFDDRTIGQNADVVESLEGGSFACGDVVTFLAQIRMDGDIGSPLADDPQTIEVTQEFLANTTGRPGAALGEIVGVSVNYGPVSGGDGPGGTDSGIDDDGGSAVHLLSSGLTGPLFQGGSELIATFLVDDLEAGERVVIRTDVRLVCQVGATPTGNLQANLNGVYLVAINGGTPVDPPGAVAVGAQTIPFKQIGQLTFIDFAIEKTASPTSVEAPGGPVTFTVTISNPESGYVLTIDSLVDDVYGDLNGQGDCVVPWVIGPDSTDSCSFVGEVTGEADSEHVNIVTATGSGVERFDDAVVTIVPGPPSVVVQKSADPASVAEPGAVVKFDVSVQNTSDATDPVTITSLTDSVFGDLNGQGTCVVPQTIQPGDTYSCSFTGLVAGDPGDIHSNLVTASGSDDEGTPVSGSDDATVTVTDLPSSITVTKTATPASLPEPGGSVTFDVVVENKSEVDTVTITSLSDSVFGDLNGQGTCAVPQIIPAGDTYACSFAGVVEGNGGDTHLNVVTASGTDDDGVPVTGEDAATVTIEDVPSAIALLKTATPTSVPEPGGDVTFSLVVDNGSPVDVVTITSIVDDVHGDLDGRGTCAVPQTIQPGGSYVCSFTAFVAGDAGDSETDVITASGTDDDGIPVSASDDATVTVTDLPSGIVVTKTADPTTIREPQGVVTFGVEIENVSPVDAVTITSLVDSVFGDLNGRGTCDVPQTIQPGETYECAFSAVVAGNTGETHVDIITATGTDADGAPVSGEDIAQVFVLDMQPVIEVTKTADPTTVPEPGGLVEFTVTVDNDSVASDPVTLTRLVDDIHGDLDGQGTCAVPQTILPGDSYTCSFTAFVAGNAGDTETDTITARVVDDDDGVLEDRDQATVTVTDVPSSLTMVKTASSTVVTEPGADVTFTFTVTNTSPVDDVTLTTLTDDVFGDLNGQGTCAVPQTLEPGNAYSCELTAFIGGNAGDVHTNVATVGGSDDDGASVSADDEAAVDVTGQAPSISVDKVAAPETIAEPGGTATFTVSVENLSVASDPVTITSLVDDVHGDLDGQGTCSVPQTIDPGAVYSCNFEAVVAGNAGTEEVDTITAAGTDDDGEPVTGQDDATVTLVDAAPQLAVSKTADPVVIQEPEGTVEFTVTVTNLSVATDPVTLTALMDDVYGDLTDPDNPALLATTCAPVTLDPGTSYTCAFTALVTGEAGDVHRNLITVDGIDDEESSVTVTDDESVDIVDVPSTVTVAKDAAPAAVPETGGDVTFTVVVTNTSATDSVTITSLVDDVFGDIAAFCGLALPASLAPGDQLTCTFVEFIGGTPAAPHLDVVTASGFDDDGIGFEVSDDAVVEFMPLIDLETTITVDPASVILGETAMFTITVTNQGPSSATGAVLEVTLPPALEYLTHMTVWSDDDRGHLAYDPATGIVTIGDLGVGETVQLMMTVLTTEPGGFVVPAEIIAADQTDIDSVPDDGMGDDYDEATVGVSQVLASGIVGDTAFLDLDADGVQDEDDPGLAGVTVNLTNLDTGVTASAVTNADGKYLFSGLPSGNYRAAVVTPEGLGLTTPGSFEFFLGDGESYLTADYGFAEILPRTGVEVGVLALLGFLLLALGFPASRAGRGEEEDATS